MSAPDPAGSTPGDPTLESVRDLLVGRERARLAELADALDRLAEVARDDREGLLEEIEALRAQLRAESEGLDDRIESVFGEAFSRKLRTSSEEIGEAIAPAMGVAIRTQIRDSREDMIEALFPIIGETVQRAVLEFTREFQRNIDYRLRQSGPGAVARRFQARLGGVSRAQLALRDALPFTIDELFLIHRESGLLIAHVETTGDESVDSDLISGMLTAIRDFAQDSFGGGDPGEELDEIQYGDQSIIIQGGNAAYVAAVISGVEPEGFRGALRALTSELHLVHGKAFRNFNGDQDALPALEPVLEGFAAMVVQEAEGSGRPRPLGRGARWLLAGGAIGLILLTLLGCFYARFTWALLPVAFPDPTATATATATSTPLPPPPATATPTVTPSMTPSVTPSVTPSATPSMTPGVTPSATASATPQPATIGASAVGNVWIREAPDLSAPTEIFLPAGAAVQIRAQQGDWYLIEWASPQGVLVGWVSAQWLAPEGPVPDALVSPTPISFDPSAREEATGWL